MRFADKIAIDGWRIDRDSHRISRDGIEKKLEPRTLELLLYLASRPGEVVTRQQIEDEVWQGRVVGYDALTGTVRKIRRAFGDLSKDSRIIETIPKVGYRLIAPVTVDVGDELVAGDDPEDGDFERKLAAIFYADVAEYSRLTGEDELHTHRQLRKNMAIVSDAIGECGGRIIHYAGDAVLADFATVSTALDCALGVQTRVAEINAHLAEEQRVLFRIGVNLGEVIVDGDEIFGDGVNVAARLESIAAAGGVCISGAVFDAIGHKQNFEFEYLGEKEVKNIARPVRCYNVHPKPGLARRDPGPEIAVRAAVSPRRLSRNAPIAAAGVALVLLAVVGLWYFFAGSAVETDLADTSTADAEQDLPALAVLPFINLSNNPGQNVYADGLTDDLINDLSHIDGLRVTPRHSSFLYRHSESPVADIASELRVRYILQGSVRRALDQLRVNAQLIDTQTDEQVWTHRFDDKIENVFRLQDQIVDGVLTAVELERASKPRSRRHTTSLEAYDYFLRAEHRRLNIRGSTRDTRTIEFYRRAIELDPQFVAAYTGLAREALFYWQENTDHVVPVATSRQLVYESAGKALELDDENVDALSILGRVQALTGAYEVGIQSVQRAIELEPANPQLQADLAVVLSYAGRHADALIAINNAIDRQKTPPVTYLGERAQILFFLRRFDEALADLDRAETMYSREFYYALIHGAAGHADRAREYMKPSLAWDQWLNHEYLRVRYGFYKRAEDIELIANSAATAGIPRYPFGYDPGETAPIAANEIDTLVRGGLWRGSSHEGNEFFQQHTGGRSIAYRTYRSMMSGEFEISDGKLCVSFRSVLLGKPNCGHIYTDTHPGHYVWVTLGNVYRFSVE